MPVMQAEIPAAMSLKLEGGTAAVRLKRFLPGGLGGSPPSLGGGSDASTTCGRHPTLFLDRLNRLGHGLGKVNTGGWRACIGNLSKGQPRLEIWLDQFADYDARKFNFCFFSSNRAKLHRLANRPEDGQAGWPDVFGGTKYVTKSRCFGGGQSGTDFYEQVGHVARAWFAARRFCAAGGHPPPAGLPTAARLRSKSSPTSR